MPIGMPMKLFTAIFSASLLLSLHALVAQDANSVPLPDPLNTGPAAQPSATPLSLIPNAPEPVEKPNYRERDTDRSPDRETDKSGTNGPNLVKKNKTAANTDDIADRIKFREAKTKALKDENIQEQWELSESAKNDPDKREALKKYYTLLYAKILKIDGSIKKLVSQRLKESLKQLDQSKVRPEEYPEQASTAH